MEIVDHQLERLLEPLELGQQPLDDRRAGEARCRTDPLDDLVAGRIGERVDQREPEPLRVALAALDRDPGDGLVRLGRPRAEENGLPAARGRTHERHGTRSRR